MRHRPDSVDRHVGVRLRFARKLSRLTQLELGEAVGMSFQQVQKYELGTSTIGAGKLYQIAQVLGVEPSFFFESMPHSTGANGNSHSRQDLNWGEAIDIVSALQRIRVTKLRHTVLAAVKQMADAAEQFSAPEPADKDAQQN